MRCVQLDFADPAFPLSLVEMDDPSLPGPEWVRVAVTRGGICGSDLHLLRPLTKASRAWEPYVVMPMQIGHEIGGVVVEAGPNSGVTKGTRVAVDPITACEVKGLPLCRRCRVGQLNVCENVDLAGGWGLGLTTGHGGGWGDQVLAHRSQLHAGPEALDERGLALAEPLAVAVHGIGLRPPTDGEPVLILGAGTIGLAAVAAVRALSPASPVVVLAKHDHQATAAEALGAHEIVRVTEGEEHLGALARACGGRVVGRGRAATISGGFPHVVEAVGSGASLSMALRYSGQRGTVHVLGAFAVTETDLTPLWLREIDLVGSATYGRAAGDEHEFDLALALLAAGGFPPELVVTHEYPLAEHRAAVETAMAREAGAIKVQLVP